MKKNISKYSFVGIEMKKKKKITKYDLNRVSHKKRSKHKSAIKKNTSFPNWPNLHTSHKELSKNQFKKKKFSGFSYLGFLWNFWDTLFSRKIFNLLLFSHLFINFDKNLKVSVIHMYNQEFIQFAKICCQFGAAVRQPATPRI